MPGLPHLHCGRLRRPLQVLLPLPQRHHLQPELLHLRLVVQLRLRRGRGSVRPQRRAGRRARGRLRQRAPGQLRLARRRAHRRLRRSRRRDRGRSGRLRSGRAQRQERTRPRGSLQRPLREAGRTERKQGLSCPASSHRWFHCSTQHRTSQLFS